MKIGITPTIVVICALLVVGWTLTTRAESDCNADVYLSDPVDEGNGHLAIEFEIIVDDCDRCSGKFDYTLVLLDEDGEIREWKRGGHWPIQDSDAPFATMEYVNVSSDESLQDVVDIEAVACACTD